MNIATITPFLLSLWLATATTIILLFICIPIAYLLAFRSFPGKSFIETLILLPMVLPPTVLGFYILIALAPDSLIGGFLLKHFNIQLVFSFWGIVFASCIHSLPFMLQPLKNAFTSINRSVIYASYTLGKSKTETLIRIIIPIVLPSIVAAMALTFAHVLGEFGVVLMVGGSIPGITKVASIAIYEQVESMAYTQAHIYSLLLVITSLLILSLVNLLQKHQEDRSIC